MLEYVRIYISEGDDVNKTNLSKEWDICHNWYFKDIGFNYEKYFYNGCHDLMQKAMSFNDVAIVLHMLREVLTEFSFGIWAKMMQLTWWMVLIWLIKGVFYKTFFIIYI